MSDAVTKATSHLVLNYPFIASVLMAVGTEEDPSVQTACTNGKIVRYNKEFAESLSIDELMSVLAHEVLHIVLLHHMRSEGAHIDKKIFNIAADIIINNKLLRNGFLLPDCISELQTYTEEHCTEDVYKDLINKSESHIGIIKIAAFGSAAGRGGDDDPSGMGAFEPDEELTKEGKEQAEENIKDIVRRAAITAKMCGDTTLSGMQTAVEELLKPKVDWRKQLTAFLTNKKPGIKSWNKPNKRLMHMGIILPGILKQRSGSIAVAIDTSGSISKKEMRIFLSELNNIRKGLNIEKLMVVYIDSKIQRIDEFESDDDVELRNIQGGGTAFIPFFEWLNKQQDIDASVYFTDGYAQYPTHVHVPNIWCMTTTAKAPSQTGDTICLQHID